MKNKKSLSLFLALLMFSVFAACSDDNNDPGLPSNPLLTLNTRQISLMNTATSGKVEIISNVSWLVLKGSGADWLTITPDKGEASSDAITVTLSAVANGSVQARTAVVKFVHARGEKMDSVIVRQEGEIAEPLRYRDSLALVALYEATRGTDWKVSWDLETPMPEWPGIVVDFVDEQTRVVEIELPDNKLVGSKFPEELVNLTELRKLVITRATLSCEIPSFIGDFKKLKFLALAENGHIGEIPESLYQLSNLNTLHLYGNALTGGISDKLGDLVNMEDINLQFNQLEGIIPSTIGNLTKLDGLILEMNKFSGPIPPELKNCANLRVAILGYNQLEGSVANTFENLENLETLDICENKLTGDLPAFNDCKRLFDFRFSNNRGLTGMLPEAWGQLDSLMIVQGRNCNLTGGIPEGYAGIEALVHVILDSNQLEGQIPEFTRKLSTFTVADNKFSGVLPVKFIENNMCQELDLSGNDLEGDVSPIFLSVNLANLQLAGMPAITGTMPDNDMDLYLGLNVLNLSGSGFSGTIPVDLFLNNSQVTVVNIADCNFTGNLPSEITNATMLSVLKVNGNRLSGSIDQQIKNHANWENWKPAVNICPQQPQYGLTNCAE